MGAARGQKRVPTKTIGERNKKKQNLRSLGVFFLTGSQLMESKIDSCLMHNSPGCE